MTHYLGIDIGGTSTRLLVMDSHQRFSGYTKLPTASWAQTPEALTALAAIIRQSLGQRQVIQAMLGLPGILSRDRQQVISLPFIKQLDNQPVARLLSDLLGLPVAIDKDVNHLLMWDLNQLPALPDSAVGFYLGTGMGNSLWLNKQFYHGAHGGAGEIGHIPWPGNDLLCPCGNHGCVETITSGSWLTRWAAVTCPHTPLGHLFLDHAQHPALQAFIHRLAQVIASEMNLLDPQYLILGGGVLSMSNFPLDTLKGTVQRHLRPPVTRSQFQMIFSSTTDETGCRGACLAARRLAESQA